MVYPKVAIRERCSAKSDKEYYGGELNVKFLRVAPLRTLVVNSLFQGTSKNTI